MATALPFTVEPFENTSGSISYRVAGSWQGERIRKNFRQHADAIALCNAKNAAVIQSIQAEALRLVQTRLTDDEVRSAEAGVQQASGRWSLPRIITAGLEALVAMPVAHSLAALYQDWLVIIKPQVGERWYKDLRFSVGQFIAAHPTLTTAGFTRGAIRAYLDGLDASVQTKINARNRLHLFGGWLIERGFFKDNPAGGIRFTKSKLDENDEAAALPPILSVVQAAAFLRACEGAECRRLLGWATLALLAGLRPESEAERLTWPEINLRTGACHVLGRKRGAKPRKFTLQPAALEYLRRVKRDRMPTPGFYLVKVRRRAVELANAILAEEDPAGEPIVWSEDILRHSYASYRSAAGVAITELAEEMGTSPRMIYAHYRNPRTKAEGRAFAALRPHG